MVIAIILSGIVIFSGILSISLCKAASKEDLFYEREEELRDNSQKK